jgi:hypothetical protein
MDPVFEQAKAFHALDGASIVIGAESYTIHLSIHSFSHKFTYLFSWQLGNSLNTHIWELIRWYITNILSSGNALDLYSGKFLVRNLARTPVILSRGFSWHSLVPRGKSRDSTTITSRSYTSKSFRIQHSSVMLPMQYRKHCYITHLKQMLGYTGSEYAHR